MAKPLLLPLAFLLVCSCRPAGDAAKAGEAMAEGGALVDGPTGKSGDPVAPEAENGAPTANATGEQPRPPLPTQIPQQFHGRWGLTPADCRGGAAAKGLLTVDDSRLTFYESKGTLDRVMANSPPSVFVANYGFSGEGMAWERVIRLERRPSSLRRIEAGSEEGPVDLTYAICPG
jgi:hypothetical protein